MTDINELIALAQEADGASNTTVSTDPAPNVIKTTKPEVPSTLYPELNTPSSTTPQPSIDLFPELKTQEDEEREKGPGILQTGVNLAGSVIEGAARKAISITNLSTATVPEPLEDIVDIADEGQNFGTKVASGVGGALTQAGVVAGSAAAGAAVGSVVPGIGTAIGGAAGAVVGGGTVLVQGIRESLFGVEQETRQEIFNEKGREAKPEELKEARTKALPGVITGQTLDTLFAVATGGAGNIAVATGKELAKTTAKEVVKGNVKGAAKGLTKAGFEPIRRKAASDFVNAQRKAQFEAVQSSVSRVGRIGKVLEGAAKASALEGTGEAIEGASTRAAAKSVAKGTGVLDEFGKEITSAEALEDFALGAAVQGTVRGGAISQEVKLAGRSDFEAGLEVLGEKTNTHQQAKALATQLAKLENPDAVETSLVIPDTILDSAKIDAIMENEDGFQITDNKDGTTTIEVIEQEAIGAKINPRAPGESLFKQTHDKSGMLPMVSNDVNSEFQVNESPITYEDEFGQTKVVTREDVLEERVTMKLLESSGIKTQITLDGPEGTNLNTQEARAEFGGEGFQALAKATDATPELVNKFKKGFDPNEGLDPTAKRAKVEADQLAERIRTEASFNNAAAVSAINKVIDQRVAKGRKGKKARDEISIQLGKDMNLVLNGMKKVETLPQELRAVTEQMRGSLDRTQLMLIDQGIAKGKLAEQIANSTGVWLHRSYTIDTDPTFADRVATDPEFAPIYNRAKNYIKLQLENKHKRIKGQLKGPDKHKSRADWVGDRIDKAVTDILTKGQSDLVDVIQGMPTEGARNLSVLQQRQDIDESIRALWGEKTNGLENYATSMAKIGALLSKHKYYTDLKYHGLREGYLSTKPNPEKGITRAITTGDDQLQNVAENPLEGMFTTPELAEALKPVDPEAENAVMKLWVTANGFTKYSKTVLNPVTHTRNFVANPLFLMANGNMKALLNKNGMNNSLSTTLSGLLSDKALNTLKDKKGKDTDTWRQEYLKFVELGLVGDSVSAGELHDVMSKGFVGDLTLNEFVDQSARKGLASKVAKAVKFDTAINLYQAEDSFWKIVAFHEERNKLRQDLGDTMTAEELDVESARIVRDTMPTFSMLPEYVKTFSRNTPFAPFLSFPAEVVRTQINTGRQIRKELADPRRRKTGQKRLAGLAMAHSAPALLAGTAKLLLGVTDDEEEAIRETVAPWDRTGTLLFFGRDSKGMPNYINLSFTDPFSMFNKTFNAASAASKDDRGLMIAALAEFFEPMTSETMLAEKIGEVWSNKKKGTGGEVFNEQDDDRVKIAKAMMHVWKAAEPGFVNTAKRFYKKGTKGTNKDVATEIMALMTGMRLTTLDEKKSLPFYGRDFSKGKKDISRLFSTPVKFDEEISNDRIATKFNNMMTKRERHYKQLHRRIKASLYLGLNEQEVRGILKDTGAVSKRDMDTVMSYGIPRFKMSNQMKKSVRKHDGRLQLVNELIRKREQGIIGR